MRNEIINLTNKEYKILCLLVKNKGKVITKEYLLETIWDTNAQYVDVNTISVTINRLRKKIDIYHNHSYIRNKFGSGYIFGD
ncbi:MAG: winged helix-turn-helix domain-containing protein [Coprobacillaceae bacterium]